MSALKKVMFVCAMFVGSVAQANVPALSVEGSRVTSGGQDVSLAGNSLFWSNTGWGGETFYTAGTVSWLSSDWGSKLVRAAMGVEEVGGYLDDPEVNVNRVTTVVDAAIANGMYVIIDWHTHHAEDYQAEAISFFQDMATRYKDNNNVIYEVYNEPLQVSWSNTIKPYAEAVIAAIRQIDPDNLIIVGTPNWSQDVDVASSDPITNYNNIAYTLHFYAGTHREELRGKARTALNNGIALFVTEWGAVSADGDGAVDRAETDAWMDFLKQNSISHANWALNDKAEGSSSLNPGASGAGGWSDADLTESGAYVKNLIASWSGSAGTNNNPPAVANSPSSSSAASVSSSSSFNSSSSSSAFSSSDGFAGGQQCNWYGSMVPLCQGQPNGWGFENNESCVGPETCSSQDGGNDGAVEADGFSSSSSVASSSSSSASNSSFSNSSDFSSSISSDTNSFSSMSSSSASSSSSSSSSSFGNQDSDANNANNGNNDNNSIDAANGNGASEASNSDIGVTGTCPAVAAAGNSGSFGTTDAYCFKTQEAISGWGASNLDGRTVSVTVNGAGPAVTVVGEALPGKSDTDYYHFQIGGGEYSWASVYWW